LDVLFIGGDEMRKDEGDIMNDEKEAGWER
jgi:hypothetical protein